MSGIDWDQAPEGYDYFIVYPGGLGFFKVDDDFQYYLGEKRGSLDIGSKNLDVTIRPSKAGKLETIKMDNVSDGSTASYYELPKGATELQHLISNKNMNSQIGEIFRSCYRFGVASHSDKLRDAKKIQFYINAEIERLKELENV